MGALRSAAVSSDAPPAHPVSAATRSQGLAPLPATERGDYGAGPECGGLGALIFREGARNQGVGGAGCAGNRRIVSGPCLLPVRAANGEGDHPKPRRGEGWWRGARPRSLLLPLHPRAEGRGGPPPHRLRRQGGDGRRPSTILRLCEASDGPPPHSLREQGGDTDGSQSADCQHITPRQPADLTGLPKNTASPAHHSWPPS